MTGVAPSVLRARLRVPFALAAATVLLQIAYPLVEGHPRDVLTVVTVLVFFAATVAHAVLTRGAGWSSAYLLVTAGSGLLAEAVGTRTGVPFGAYSYADSLGWKLFGVPVVIPLAWAMFAYPCLLVGQRLAKGPAMAALLGGAALASWDLFLDPQMVAAGHWRWLDVRHQLPGVDGIPISNFVGWLGVALVIVGLLQVLPRRESDDRIPFALFGWTYVSSVLANAAFFGRPGVALAGGLGMGIVAVPLLWSLRR